MSCFTLLRILDVCRWILISISFLLIDTLCQRLRSCTPNICSQRECVYYFYCVHFICCLFGFALLYSLSFSSCSLLVHLPPIVQVFDFFCFCKHLFATMHLYVFIIPIFFVFVNISLQQSTCIMFISCVARFALFCCLLLSSYSLLVLFPHCLGSRFFVSLNNFLQQSTFFLVWMLGYNLVMLLP